MLLVRRPERVPVVRFSSSMNGSEPDGLRRRLEDLYAFSQRCQGQRDSDSTGVDA
jgi:hypothetical protein